MTSPAVAHPLPAISPAVQGFATQKGVGRYLIQVIEVARQAFPSSALEVSLQRDAEDDTHQYIAIDVETSGRETEELLSGQRAWSAGVARVCPSQHAVYFVLGWR